MSYNNSHLWWTHARWPLAVFIVIAMPLAVTDWDSVIAHTLFFNPTTAQWLATDSFWANDVVHTGGRWMIRAVVATLFVGWLVSHRVPSLRPWRRSIGYASLSMVLSIALVGVLKTLTNVDCPWDLEGFGGHFPLVHLLADRPDGLPRGHCFPAAHASSG